MRARSGASAHATVDTHENRLGDAARSVATIGAFDAHSAILDPKHSWFRLKESAYRVMTDFQHLGDFSEGIAARNEHGRKLGVSICAGSSFAFHRMIHLACERNSAMTQVKNENFRRDLLQTVLGNLCEFLSCGLARFEA